MNRTTLLKFGLLLFLATTYACTNIGGDPVRYRKLTLSNEFTVGARTYFDSVNTQEAMANLGAPLLADIPNPTSDDER